MAESGSGKIELPSKEEIAKLPRLAQIAFAARCARRVQPLFRYSWPAAPADDESAFDRAVSYAERCAGSAEEVAVVNDIPIDPLKSLTEPEYAPDSNSDAAATAAVEAYRSIWDLDAVPRAARAAALSAVALPWQDDVVRAMRRDFELLRVAAESSTVRELDRNDDRSLRLEALRRVLLNLPDNERQMVYLRYGTRQTFDDLCKTLKIAKRSAEHTMNSARDRLWRVWSELSGDASWEDWLRAIRSLVSAVPPEFFGPLWPGGVPEGWPLTEVEGDPEPAELLIELEVPDDADDDEVTKRLSELVAEMDGMHRAMGGGGLKVSGVDVEVEAGQPVGVSS